MRLEVLNEVKDIVPERGHGGDCSQWIILLRGAHRKAHRIVLPGEPDATAARLVLTRGLSLRRPDQRGGAGRRSKTASLLLPNTAVLSWLDEAVL